MTSVVVTDTGQTVVIREPQTQTIVTGMMGPPGASSFAGLSDVAITDLQEGDLLTRQGSVWVNTQRANVTDGGNF